MEEGFLKKGPPIVEDMVGPPPTLLAISEVWGSFRKGMDVPSLNITVYALKSSEMPKSSPLISATQTGWQGEWVSISISASHFPSMGALPLVS